MRLNACLYAIVACSMASVAAAQDPAPAPGGQTPGVQQPGQAPVVRPRNRDPFGPPAAQPFTPYNPGFDGARRDYGARADGPSFIHDGETRQRVRTDPFRWPRGYYFAQRQVGETLPQALIMRNYALRGWELRRFGLAAADPGRQWLRVGDDALLVDLTSRRIEAVVAQAYY
jgi:Ni/Co efflux regulator RcnB